MVVRYSCLEAVGDAVDRGCGEVGDCGEAKDEHTEVIHSALFGDTVAATQARQFWVQERVCCLLVLPRAFL